MSRLLSRKLSSFRAVTTLRLVRSWTRWRRNRTQARLERAVQRQTLLLELLTVQHRRVQSLEEQLHPLQRAPRLELPLLSETPVATEQELEAPVLTLEQPVLPEPTPEELEPLPPATVQIAAELGLLMPPS